MTNSLTVAFRKQIFSICAVSFLTILPTVSYSQKLVSRLPFNQAAVKQTTAPALQGPDASKPYFHVRFALPIPPDNDKERNGHLVGIDAAVADHHHSPGFEVMPNGDALMVSFSGPSSREGGFDLRIVQARLRYGAEEFDMPEQVGVEGVKMEDLRKANGEPFQIGPPLLWREANTVWMFVGGYQWQGYTQPPLDTRPGAFSVFKSTDNGATWNIVALEPKFSGLNADKQPITNAFRAPNGDMFVACDGISGEGTSMLWRSSDNGLSWTDQGGRTSGRHSTIVPLDNKGTLLSLGGKDTQIRGYMPQNISRDWGKTWEEKTQSTFPWLGANQRPSVIKLASGHLIMVGDSRFIHNPAPPKTWKYGDNPYVALSTDNGMSWTIKPLPVALKHEHRLHKTVGYTTVRQSPNGLIHVFVTMTHPCLHYEFNEAWITDSIAGDIIPENTGGKVKSYKEKYPDGKIRATWNARITPGGRYLLNGREKCYYPNGKIQREVVWENGRPKGEETFWAPDGARIWSWNHDLANNTSTWTHWYLSGQKRLESEWNTNPTARDLPERHFLGLIAHGKAMHWDESGRKSDEYTFVNGNRVSHRGNHSETFNTLPKCWTSSGNSTDGNNFGWSATSYAQNNNAPYMTDKGEIGGVIARSVAYRWFADTNIATKSRKDTLYLTGMMKVADVNFKGVFRFGYFDTTNPGANFIGIEFKEPAGTILDPKLHGSGKAFRAYITVYGPGGTISTVPLELDGSAEKAFDLRWTGKPDGSGTLSGTIQSVFIPAIKVAAGIGNFNAFGILAGGDSSDDPTKLTGGIWFDDLNYNK
jgi:antitoxin component YwqK of YwqJK toxin-antitoxin module